MVSVAVTAPGTTKSATSSPMSLCRSKKLTSSMATWKVISVPVNALGMNTASTLPVSTPDRLSPSAMVRSFVQTSLMRSRCGGGRGLRGGLRGEEVLVGGLNVIPRLEGVPAGGDVVGEVHRLGG